MSDFPMPDKYRNQVSTAQLRFLKENGWNGADGALPIVIKKEKGQFLYDIDGNKYTDFHMSNGSAIAGHDHRTLTQFIKNGISAGMSSGNINKFVPRLVKQFRGLSQSPHIAFFNQASSAYASVIRAVKPASIGVTSAFLLNALKAFGAEMTTKGKKYDLVFFEPVDFEGELEDLDIKKAGWTAGVKCAVESRTAFRFNKGFLSAPGSADMVLCADVIANGLDSAAVLSDKPVESENLPVFRALAILETLKYFDRMLDQKTLDFKTVRAGKNENIIFRKNIFKIRKPFDAAALLKYGVHIRNAVGFLCTEHTEFDWKRLENALKSSGN